MNANDENNTIFISSGFISSGNASRKPLKGRGAVGNPTGRFEAITREDFRAGEIDSFCAGTENPDASEIDETFLKTQFYKDNTQSILSYNDSPDVGFDVSINPYRGCEHGCIYCYARPTHEYLGLSAGQDFESKIFVKTNAAALLRKTLEAKSWTPQSIAMSGVTDPYQPPERVFKITRQCLEVLVDFRNPVGLITKNHLVTRDIDLLSQLAEFNAVRVYISLTTLDDSLATTMEPRTAQPAMRLRAIRELSAAGIPVGIMMAPIIPGLTDHEIDRVLDGAASAGARSAVYSIVRLPYGVKELFPQWLDVHFPDRKQKIINRLKDMRGGRVNDSRFGHRASGQGAYAAMIDQQFTLAKKRHGLDQRLAPLSSEHFRRPGERQLSLF